MMPNFNSTVSSLLARCLSDGEFRRSLSECPQKTLAAYTLDNSLVQQFSALDHRAVECFGGLITQTQHNFLWESYPSTRALMKRYAAELSIFADYRQTLSRKKPAQLTREQKTDRFIDYLMKYLSGNRRARFPGLFEVATHEHNIRAIAQSLSATTLNRTAPDLQADSFDQLVPRYTGEIRLATYRCDPVKTINALQTSGTGVPAIPASRTRLVYLPDVISSAVRVLKVGASALALLRHVDGTRTTLRLRKTLSRHFSGRHGATKFRQLLTQAAHAGIVRLESPNETGLR